MKMGPSQKFLVIKLSNLLQEYFQICLIIFILANFVQSKDQYVQPLNMGMQVAIPYDIANIFNRPVNFGPISALLSAGCLLYLIFFGIITSPFGYFFGVPSEKYVLGESWKTLPEKEKTARVGHGQYYNPQQFQAQHPSQYPYPQQSGGNPYQNPNYYGQTRSFVDSGENVNLAKIDFETQIFSGKLGAEVKDVECRKMVVCSAHNGLHQFPHSFIKGYQFFSKKLFSISRQYRNAILDGIEGKESCHELYPQCKDNLFGILVRSLVNLMPKWSRKKSRRS